MAKCVLCGKEMMTAAGCGISTVVIDGKKYERIKMGDRRDFFFGEMEDCRCGDCGAKMNGYHHWGCDCERCPKCGGQLIGCDCKHVFAGSAPRHHGKKWN